MKKMMAIAMLAVVASLGSQTAFADGVLLSDRPVSEVKSPDMINILVVFIKTGFVLGSRDAVILSD
jgi:hypothetical protein